MNRTELKGTVKLTLERSSLSPYQWVEIAVADPISKTTALRIRVNMEDVTKLLSALPAECTFDLLTDHVGLVREAKTVDVPLLAGDEYNVREIMNSAKRLEPFEVDGWEGNLQDCHDSHERTKTGHMVRFHRWKEPV